MKNSSKKLSVSKFYDSWRKQLSLELISNKPDNVHKITETSVGIIDADGELIDGEIYFLTYAGHSSINMMSKNKRESFLKSITERKIPCLIAEKKIRTNSTLLNRIRSFIPVFRTGLDTDDFLFRMEKILRDELTPFETLHGVLIDIHRLGVLILGKSGIGKSESALDLVNRGSKLIADDVIEIRKTGNMLIGTGPGNIRHLMEIRGVGIINIKDLFGSSSVLKERQIDLVIELDHWDQQKEYDRLGFDTQTYKIMDTEIPYLLIPVSPGRNTSTIIEVAVRNQLLKINRQYDKDIGSGEKESDSRIDI